MIVKWAFWFE